MSRATEGYTRVRPTEEEVRRAYGTRKPAVYFGVCKIDGTRMFLSGFGIGSHERGRKHLDAEQELLDERRARLYTPNSKVCIECGRVFDLTDEIDANEWAYGHDCEASDDD